MSTSSVSIGRKNKVSLGKKMIIQLAICVCIYGIMCLINNKENDLCKKTISSISNVLNYDIDYVQIYNNCVEFFKESNHEKENQDEQGILEESETQEETPQQEEIVTQEEIVPPTDIVPEEQSPKEEQPEKSQMELDADYIKQNYNLIIPVSGNITSGFGEREPTEIISAFHQGIDISAVQGTPISASMGGTVIAASYAGDYGNHIKIQNGDVVTVYAHCSELDVSVGDNITQNQIIGKVGATRESNRCTFTF